MKNILYICIIAIGMIAGAQKTNAQVTDFQGTRWHVGEMTAEKLKAQVADPNLFNSDKGWRVSHETFMKFLHASLNQALADARMNGIKLHPYQDTTIAMDTITMDAVYYMVSKGGIMNISFGRYTNTTIKKSSIIIEDKTTEIHVSDNLKFFNFFCGYDKVALGIAKMTSEMGPDSVCCNVPFATYFVFPRENKPVVVTPTPTPTPAPVVVTPTPVVVAPAQPTIVYVPQIEYVPQYIPVVQPQPQVCCGGYNEGYIGNGGWGVNAGFNAGFSASVGFSTGYSYPEYYGNGGCNNCGGSNGGGGISNVFNNTDSHDYNVNDNSYYNYQNNVGNTTSWSQANTTNTSTTTHNNQQYHWGTTPAVTVDVPWHGGPGFSPDPYDPIDPVDGWGGGTGGAPDGRMTANTKNGVAVAVSDSWSQQKTQSTGNSGWGNQNQKNTESTQRTQAQSGNQYGTKNSQTSSNSGWGSKVNNQQSQQRVQAQSGGWGQQRQASRPTGNGNRAGGQNTSKTKSSW